MHLHLYKKSTKHIQKSEIEALLSTASLLTSIIAASGFSHPRAFLQKSEIRNTEVSAYFTTDRFSIYIYQHKQIRARQ